MRFRWYHVLGGAGAYATAAVGAYYAFAPPSVPPTTTGGAGGELDDARRRAIFDANASHYDSDIAMHERLAGITSLREQVVASARGRVLEVAAGTGRNLAHYASRRGGAPLASLTLADFSVGMLSQAEAALRALPAAPPHPVHIVAADAHALPFPAASYDTVIDTFGLCSFDNPVGALREMARVTSPGGRILLLEHGRSPYGWLSGFLDRHAPAHAHAHGCLWNRDIDALVAAAGLVVLSRQDHHLGTTLLLVCAPKAAAGGEGGAGGASAAAPPAGGGPGRPPPLA